MLCFLVSQAVSALSNLTDWFLEPPKDCPVKPDRPVPRTPPAQAVSVLPTPAPSWGLTSGAKVLVPSPHPRVSIFGACASSSDDLFSSRSAFQYSDLLLHSSLHLEIRQLGWSFHRVGDFPGCGIPFSSTVPFRECPSSSDSPSLTLFSLVLPSYVTRFLLLLEFRFFCQLLIAVLCESFNL